MFLCVNEAITGEMLRLVGYAPPSVSIINLIQTNLKKHPQFCLSSFTKKNFSIKRTSDKLLNGNHGYQGKMH